MSSLGHYWGNSQVANAAYFWKQFANQDWCVLVNPTGSILDTCVVRETSCFASLSLFSCNTILLSAISLFGGGLSKIPDNAIHSSAWTISVHGQRKLHWVLFKPIWWCIGSCWEAKKVDTMTCATRCEVYINFPVKQQWGQANSVHNWHIPLGLQGVR